MSTEQKDLDQNALAERMNRFWTNFKQGKVLGYKLMAVLLILIASAIAIAYILYERNRATSRTWLGFEEASTQSAFEEISKNNPNTMEDRLARLEIARNQLGVAGIDQLAATMPDQRKKAVESIEAARDSLAKLVGEFKNEPLFKVQCLLGLAKAEAALVAVPTKEGQLTDFKGQISRVVELLDQVAQVAAPDTPWATDSKKLADALRDPNSPTRHAFVRIQQTLINQPSPENAPPILGPGGFDGFPKGPDPWVPGVPLPPGKGPKTSGPATTPPTPSSPLPPEAPTKTTPAPTPGGPIPPTPPGTPSSTGKEPLTPVAPEPKAPTPPGTGPTPVIPDPKAPTPPTTPPPSGVPDPKAPTPPTKTPDPKMPIPPTPPEKK